MQLLEFVFVRQDMKEMDTTIALKYGQIALLIHRFVTEMPNVITTQRMLLQTRLCDGVTCMSIHLPETAKGDCLACHCKATCEYGECKCQQGFFGNGLLCVPDPDDCINYPGLCHSTNGQCNMTRRRCECKKGYTGNGIDCSGKVSCIQQPGVCHPSAECQPTGHCRCNEGFFGDGISCSTESSKKHLANYSCPARCSANSECVNGACKC
uniref:EGF-like domain-containing protein n=1 Tax=Ditylenchus dipsaci TaxID=166011 RepID=A0A915CUE8_9BILA